MAYFYHDKSTGESGIGGEPSVEEIEMGKAIEERQHGKVIEWEPDN